MYMLHLWLFGTYQELKDCLNENWKSGVLEVDLTIIQIWALFNAFQFSLHYLLRSIYFMVLSHKRSFVSGIKGRNTHSWYIAWCIVAIHYCTIFNIHRWNRKRYRPFCISAIWLEPFLVRLANMGSRRSLSHSLLYAMYPPLMELLPP